MARGTKTNASLYLFAFSAVEIRGQGGAPSLHVLCARVGGKLRKANPFANINSDRQPPTLREIGEGIGRPTRAHSTPTKI